eukprot:2808709-Prymnesium_polylepis.2
MASSRRRPNTSFSSPVTPAAGSAWPMLALTPPTASGRGKASSQDQSTAPTRDPASIGSPNAVPVPCASVSVRFAADNPPSPHAANSSPCCAWPLGAVRLALRPSCRTALPSKASHSTS